MTAEPTPIRRDVVDLAAIVDRHPIRVVYMDTAAVLNGLSVGDMIELEAILGVEFTALASAPRMAVLAALAYLIGRRDDPTLTIEDVRASWRIEVREDPTLAPPSKTRRRESSQSPA